MLTELAALVISPHFRAIRSLDNPRHAEHLPTGSMDRRIERLISRRLAALSSGVPVLGEEACTARPHLLHALGRAPWLWLVDPLDGSANFAAGRPEYATMVALVRRREVVAGWIVQPESGAVYTAERGGGAWLNGERLPRRSVPAEPDRLVGSLPTRFLPPEMKIARRGLAAAFGQVTEGSGCAGTDHPAVATGHTNFALFHRVLPWDHAPGCLLLTESGGAARWLNGRDYGVDRPGTGLLLATDHASWRAVHQVYLEVVPKVRPLPVVVRA